jgi:hypothetical protein
MAIVAAPGSQWEKMMGTLRASPGKSSAAGLLGLVMIIVWGRLLLGAHSPAAARAGVVGNPSTVGQAPVTAPMPHRIVLGGETLQQWSRTPIGTLGRNPFAVPFDFYPRDASVVGTETSGGANYWDLVKKSMASRADQQEQRQILVDNVRIAAEALKLEAIVLGAAPGAMVNGQLVREGSSVAGFHVLKIQPRRLIVEREGVKLALMMD